MRFRFVGWCVLVIDKTRANSKPPSDDLIFTTQRGGSTWFCDVLDAEIGVKCGVAGRNEVDKN